MIGAKTCFFGERMKIAIDARMMKTGSMHGIARYVYNLLNCFKQIHIPHQIYMIINKSNPLERSKWPVFMHFIKAESQWISFKEQWEIPWLLKKYKIDLFHAPSFVAPLVCPTRMVMTIHDLNHLVLPQYYTPLHIFYYQTLVKSCIKKSKYILTVSKFSKAEIVRNLSIDPGKICVTYNGVSENYKPVFDKNLIGYVRDLYSLPEQFIFCLSNSKPHKNIQQLVRAFCFSNVNIPLVLASSSDPALIRLAEQYDKKHLLHFTRFIDEKHLPIVYSMTKLFVYPSTYEGFGLPPLEALSCGTPVVVAKSASLPEVVGDQATFMNPYDYQDIAKALEITVEGEYMSEAHQKGRISYAKQFSWFEMASKTMEVYEKC